MIGPKTDGVLYHYTSHESLYSIVESRAIRASHVYFLNDSNEIKYAIDRFVKIAEKAIQEASSDERLFLEQLHKWLQHLRNTPHYIFVFSLSEKGNLLSQWRAYTQHGTGVSIGFNQVDLESFISSRRLELVKCIYEKENQDTMLWKVLHELTFTFCNDKQKNNVPPGPLTQEYFPYLNKFTGTLLRAFVRIKDPAFHEECEWRLVSKFFQKYTDPDIKFRSGKTALVPFIEINLNGVRSDGLLFEQVYVGPSPNFELAFSAISAYLSNKKACKMTINSLQPYREI